MSNYTVFALVLAGLRGIAFDDSEKAKTGSKAITPQSSITCSLILPKDCSGGIVPAKVVVHNQGDSPATYYWRIHSFDAVQSTVLNSRNRAVPLTRFGSRHYPRQEGRIFTSVRHNFPEKVPARGMREIVVPLNRLYDLTISDKYTVATTLLVNKYARPTTLNCTKEFTVSEPELMVWRPEEQLKNLRPTAITRKQGVELSAFVPRKCVTGGPVELKCVIANRNKHAVRYHETSRQIFDIRIVDRGGHEVSPTLFGSSMALKTSAGSQLHELPGGENRAFVIPLHQLVDLSIAEKYTMTIRLRINELAKAPYQLETHEIELLVEEPE